MRAESVRRLGLWEWFLVAIVLVGTPVAAIRFTQGLGAVTNLTDAYPWGLWKAFNVVAGIAIGGVGFTTMGLVYVLGVKEFRPLARLALLAAFLAYLGASVSLAVDIGKPWTLWHPIVMWNPHSVLFEVAWCLMLYTGVLVLEGSAMVFERLGWDRLVRIQHAFTVPIVIAGVVLSTLHQSSLGALFLLIPGKLHPIWYTEALPLLFFVSAVASGLAMALVLSRLAVRRLGARIQTAVMTDVARVLSGVLAVYGVIRMFDLARRGAHVAAFSLSYESCLFLVEFLLGVVLPVVLLGFRRVRETETGLYAAGMLVLFGFVANRLNVAITGIEAAQGGHYVPAAAETLISLLIVAVTVLAFNAGVRLLAVLPGRPPAGMKDAA